jgi:hypothetical protein
MPTFRHGKNTLVLLDGYDVSSYFKESTTSRSIETSETTSFGSSAKTYIVGLKDGTLSLSGMFDGSTNAIDSIFNTITGSATDSIVTVGLEGSTIGTMAHMVGVQEISYEVTSPVADVVTVSAEFQANGGLDSGRVLAPATVVTTATTTNNTSVDNAAATTNGGVGHVHVTANANNGTTTIKVQHSTDNSTWVDLITFSTVATTVTAARRVEVAAGTTVNRYLRAQITTAGTGSITTSVAFARR